MFQINHSRKSGKNYYLVSYACTIARAGRKALIVAANEEHKKILKDIVDKIMQNTWPIGLKIVTPKEEFDYEKFNKKKLEIYEDSFYNFPEEQIK